MIIFPLLLAAAATQGPSWAHFSRAQMLAGIDERVEIFSGRRNGGDFRYIFSLSTTKHKGHPAIQWADSTSCPAIPAIVAGMRRIAMPRPAPYGVPGEPAVIVVDGSMYELAAPSSDVMGQMTISSNEGSPLSAWVDAALTRLGPCWSTSPPK